MNRSKLILALAGLTLALQVVSVEAHAQSAREKCRKRDSRTVGGAAIGGILGGIAGAIAGGGKDKGIAIGAGVGAVGGAVVRGAEGSDACREVDMDRADREEARRDREEARRDRRDGGYDRYEPNYPAPSRGGSVLPRHVFEQDFLRYYTSTYSDEQRLQQVADLAYDLERRNELIDGYALYQVMVRIDGGRQQRLSANRLAALRMLERQVVGLNYDERHWIDDLFPNKRHSAYGEASYIIRRLSY